MSHGYSAMGTETLDILRVGAGRAVIAVDQRKRSKPMLAPVKPAISTKKKRNVGTEKVT
ncbi:hypothetical protein [Neorhizobium petrolearium]|uniref:Uncharacterized protein n=1 Tax=Neorhizobium petrolearium TaxID=515361 RepID=A0ABY8MBF9_9HYPH|nr:hypothetical protein [Neorhizobium petrolearium]MCC2610932.1 hypothetical protein [Neorhizobium petrolearium]WGI71044.1 hypothetical protein QEO92_13860 [Neorhizobium petrolearium]